jgi:hypothetical protein
LKRAFLYIALLITGNVISAINQLKKNNVKSILEPTSKNFKVGSPFFIFMISEIIEGLPSRIPMPFHCYERALTARFVFNLFKIKSYFYVGFNPNAITRKEKLHAWLSTDICDVCGFSIKDKYVVLKKYE